MNKKAIIILMAVIILITAVFTACNDETYVDPQTSEEYYLVTDENGEKVLSPDGELLIHVTDADGEKVTNSDGTYVTEIHGFVGQIENDGVIEDYAYYFTLPDGWKAISDRGEFENKSTDSTLTIRIVDETINDNIAKKDRVYKALTENSSAEEGTVTVIQNTVDYEFLGKVYTICVSYDGITKASIAFVNNGNTYEIELETSREITVEEVEKEAIAIIGSLKFKPYTYYPNLTDTQPVTESTTKAVTE